MNEKLKVLRKCNFDATVQTIYNLIIKQSIFILFILLPVPDVKKKPKENKQFSKERNK